MTKEHIAKAHAAIAAEQYVDKTGTAEKPDPMRDVYLEFPLAMMAVAEVTKFGATKHAPRGWQTFDPEYGMDYHRSKVGRHLLKEELEGTVNHEDGDLLHPAQTVWNMLAYLEHLLRNQVVEVANPSELQEAKIVRDQNVWLDTDREREGWYFWEEVNKRYPNQVKYGPYATEEIAEYALRRVRPEWKGGEVDEAAYTLAMAADNLRNEAKFKAAGDWVSEHNGDFWYWQGVEGENRSERIGPYASFGEAQEACFLNRVEVD